MKVKEAWLCLLWRESSKSILVYCYNLVIQNVVTVDMQLEPV